MVENLPDTNVGNIEYIRKEDALDAISCDITITGKENAEIVCKAIASFADGIKALEPADVVPYSIEPDGTLTVTVPKGTKRIGRILIEEDGTQYGGLFYPDTGGCFLSSMERSEQDGQKDNH